MVYTEADPLPAPDLGSVEASGLQDTCSESCGRPSEHLSLSRLKITGVNHRPQSHDHSGLEESRTPPAFQRFVQTHELSDLCHMR